MIVWHGVVNAIVTPPGLLLLPMALGLALLGRKPLLGRLIILTSWTVLLALSLPVVAALLARAWEREPALNPPLPQGPQAIVVLAANRYRKAPEYGGHTTVGADTLVRLRYARRLFHETHLPILVSGGAPLGGPPTARLMRHVLQDDFHTPVRWVEGRSRTTAQNARDSARILKPLGIRRIFLVTQAWHMPRAVLWFRRAGLVVTPAPTGFTTAGARRHTLLAYLPSAPALALSALIFHEMIGVLWAHAQGVLPRETARLINHA